MEKSSKPSRALELLSPTSRRESVYSRAQELQKMRHPPHKQSKTPEQWAENRAWALMQEVKHGRMTWETAIEMSQKVYKQLQSDPMPDPLRERMQNLLFNPRGSTF